MKLKQLLNLPNYISALRLVAIPFFVQAVLNNEVTSALLILSLALITDLADGRIARKMKINSGLGGIIDMGCDGAFLLAGLLAFISQGKFPLFAFVLFAFGAALQTGGVFLIVRSTGLIKSTIWSKLTGGFLYVLFYFIILDVIPLAVPIYTIATYNILIGIKRKYDGIKELLHVTTRSR